MCTLQERRMVVPSGLHRSPFTSGAVDNIDSNPPSFIAKGSFHGTARYYSRIQTLKAIGGVGGGVVEWSPLTYMLKRHHSSIFLITSLRYHPSPRLIGPSRFLLQQHLCNWEPMKKNLWSNVNLTGFSTCNATAKMCQQKTISVRWPCTQTVTSVSNQKALVGFFHSLKTLHIL